MNLNSGILQLGRTLYNNALKSRHILPILNLRFISLEEKIGLPPKPKRPLNPYFRFLKQVRPTIVQQNPKASVVEITKLIAEQWEKLELKEKQNLDVEFKKDLEKYAVEKLKYDSNVSEEDKQKLVIAKQQKELSKIIREKRKKRKEFQKPRKAPSAFVLWMKNEFKNRGDQPFRSFQLQLAEKWRNMSDAEKQPYVEKTKELAKKYKEDIALWEEKMIRLGNIDIVRGESLLEPKKGKVEKTKKSQ